MGTRRLLWAINCIFKYYLHEFLGFKRLSNCPFPTNGTHTYKSLQPLVTLQSTVVTIQVSLNYMPYIYASCSTLVGKQKRSCKYRVATASLERDENHEAAPQNGQSSHSVYSHNCSCSGVTLLTRVDMLYTYKWRRMCGLRDHPVSLRPTSTCEANWRELFTPNAATHGTSFAMPLKLLGRQYAICLTSLSGTGILGATWLSYELNVTADSFNIFCKPSEAGQMPFCSQLMSSLTTTTLHVYMSTFLSSCFLFPYLTNVAVKKKVKLSL
jgi:hypothetical protein